MIARSVIALPLLVLVCPQPYAAFPVAKCFRSRMPCPLACKQGKAMAAPQHRRHFKLKIEARLRGRGRLQFLIRALTVFMRDRPTHRQIKIECERPFLKLAHDPTDQGGPGVAWLVPIRPGATVGRLRTDDRPIGVGRRSGRKRASPPRSRMQESNSHRSVRGAFSNERPTAN